MKVPIVFSFDDNFALPASIAIKSLVDCAGPGTEYEIYVFHDGLSRAVMDKMGSIADIRWVKVDPSLLDGIPETRQWPRNVCYRMLIPEILRDYEKVIWSDVDVLFRGDVSALLGFDLSDSDLAAVAAERNTPEMACHPYHPENANEFVFWSGLLVFNCDRWRKRGLFSSCVNVLREHRDKLRFFDLETLNMVCRNIVRLPLEYCVLESLSRGGALGDAAEYSWLSKTYLDAELDRARSSPVIVHYTGINPKIWNRRREDIPDYYWRYIESSPFFRRDFFFPTAATHLRSAILLLAYKMCPVHGAREALKGKWRRVKWKNQYQRAQLKRLEAGNGNR